MRSLIILISSLFLSAIAQAEPIATVANLVGNAFVSHDNDSPIALKTHDKITETDSVSTEADTFLLLKFIDNGEMIIRPNTTLKIKEYKFNKSDPKTDKSFIELVKGGVRRLTGFIGKRGNKDADQLVTATATIGIRGTIYDALYCKGDCGNLTDSTYLHVVQGSILVSNDAGQITLDTGGYSSVPSTSILPQTLSQDPGLPKYTAPRPMPEYSTNGAECRI